MLCWFLMSESLRRRKYREEIDFIKANTETDMLLVMPETGVITEDYDQCHSLMADLVGYAHSKGIGITLYASLGRGFFNGGMDPNVSDAIGHLEMFTIKRPEDAQGIAISGETTADADGFAVYTHEAKWGRRKIRPLRAKLLRVYAFDKAGDGFTAPLARGHHGQGAHRRVSHASPCRSKSTPQEHAARRSSSRSCSTTIGRNSLAIPSGRSARR